MSNVNHAAGRIPPTSGHKRRSLPTAWVLIGLAVVVTASGLAMYRSATDQDDLTDREKEAAQSDFWQRPGARTLGSNATMGDSKTPATGTLAVVEAVEQSLTRSQALTINSNGGIQVNRALRNKLDDTLGWDDGPVSPEALERARQALRKELSGPAATQALDVLQRYAAYRNAAAEQQDRAAHTPALPASLGVMGEAVELQRKEALRSQMLSVEMRDAFFGDEEALARYRLTMRQLQTLSSLSDAERDEQLRPLWQQLPAHLRTQIPEPGTPAIAQTR